MNVHPRLWLMHSPELLEYSFGPDHPMGDHRVRLALELSQHFGLLEHFHLAAPPEHCEAHVARVHAQEYIEAQQRGEQAEAMGIGDHDHPVRTGLEAIAAKVVGASVAAAEAVWTGAASRAVNIAGGLHHAQQAAQRGFCVYNDAAAAIAWLLDHGAQRVAYLDLDAHHGDGVEQMFWDDPRVLTISVHESGLYLFPHTGFAKDIGGTNAMGTAVNIALNRHTEDLEWLRALHGIIPPLLRRFSPEIIVSQHGGDPHKHDPLADLDLSVDAMALAYRSVAKWADRYAHGKWVVIGGGGYHRDAVARVWTQLLAAVAEVELAPDSRMPDHWEQRVAHPSRTLGDPGAADLLADFRPEQVVGNNACAPMLATSRAVFPYWGLEPYRG